MSNSILPFAFGKYSGHLANVRKITQKSEPCLSQASFRRGDEGPDEDGRTYGCTMWLSAILFSFFLTLTFCEEKKDTDKGPIVRARLEVC